VLQGIWTQIEAHLLPPMCSSDELCVACPTYGEFPCAWCVPALWISQLACSLMQAPCSLRCFRYKIAFVFLGLIGQYYTRSLYNDTEVTYSRRNASLSEQCAACGWCSCGEAQQRRRWGART
jgi:hypothetical protein